MRVDKMTDENLSCRFKKHAVFAGGDYQMLLEKIHKAYISELEKQQAIDFDDMIILVN